MYTAALLAACSGGTYSHNHSTHTYTAHRMYTAALPAVCSGGTYSHNHSTQTYTAHRMYTAAPPSSLQRWDIPSQSQYIHCTQDVHRGPPAVCSGGTYRHNHSTYTAHRMYTAAPSSLQRRDIQSQSQSQSQYIHCTVHTGCTPRPPSSLQRRDIQSQSQYTDINCTQDVHRGPPAVCSGGTYRHNQYTDIHCTQDVHRGPPSSLQRRDIQSQSQYTYIHCTQDVHRGLPAACSGGTYSHNHSTHTYTAHRMYTAAPQQSAAAGHTVTITVHTLHTGCTPRPPSSLQRRDIQSQSQYTDIHRTQDVHRGPHGSLEGVGGLKTNEAYHSKADALLIPEMYYFFFGKFTYALFRNVCFIKFGTFSAMLALPVMIREEYGQMAHQTFPNILLSNAWLRSRASLGLSMTTHLTRAR